MITPATSIQIPWRIAELVRAAFKPTIIALESVGEFWRTWSEVYRGQ